MSPEKIAGQESLEKKFQRMGELAAHCLGEDIAYAVALQTDTKYSSEEMYRLEVESSKISKHGLLCEYKSDAKEEAMSLLKYNDHKSQNREFFIGIREEDQIVAIGNNLFDISWAMPMSATLLYSIDHDVEFKFKGGEESSLESFNRYAPENIPFQGTLNPELLNACRIDRSKEGQRYHRIIDFYQTKKTLETKYPYWKANVLWPARTRDLTKIWAFVTPNPQEMISYIEEKCSNSHELRPLPGYCDANAAIEIHSEANENDGFAILAYSHSQWQNLMKKN